MKINLFFLFLLSIFLMQSKTGISMIDYLFKTFYITVFITSNQFSICILNQDLNIYPLAHRSIFGEWFRTNFVPPVFFRWSSWTTSVSPVCLPGNHSEQIPPYPCSFRVIILSQFRLIRVPFERLFWVTSVSPACLPSHHCEQIPPVFLSGNHSEQFHPTHFPFRQSFWTISSHPFSFRAIIQNKFHLMSSGGNSSQTIWSY